jgi:hypothetical protein
VRPDALVAGSGVAEPVASVLEGDVKAEVATESVGVEEDGMDGMIAFSFAVCCC